MTEPAKETAPEEFKLAPVKLPVPTEAEIEMRFRQLVDMGQIAVAEDDQYIVARSTRDKAEAVLICDRFEQIHQFDRIKSICFVNGMVDGIRTYMREAKKLGPLKTEAVIKIGNSILQYLDREKLKI